MERIFTLLLFLSSIQIINGQNGFSWNTVSPEDSISYIYDLESNDYREIFVASMRKASGSAVVYGESSISMYDKNGNIEWQENILGESRISDLISVDSDLYFIGQSKSEINIASNIVGPLSMFFGKMDVNGSVEWVISSDSLYAYNSRLGVNSASEIIISAEINFRNSYILKFDSLGNILNDKFLSETLVGDISIGANDEIIIGGMCTGMSTIDNLILNPPTTYSNSVLKLEEDFTAEWITYTEYITFDYHQRVEILNDRIIFFNRKQSNLNPLAGYINSYDMQGNQIQSEKINSFMQVPRLEMDKFDDKISIIYEGFNFSLPTFKDSIRVEIIDENLERLNEFVIRTELESNFFGEPLFQVSADSCATLVTAIFDGNLFFQNQIVNPVHNKNNMLVAAIDNCIENRLNNSEKNDALKLYPNPAIDLLFLEYEPSGLSRYIIYNSLGAIVKEGNLNNAINHKIEIDDLQKGVFIMTISGEDNQDLFIKQFLKE